MPSNFSPTPEALAIIKTLPNQQAKEHCKYMDRFDWLYDEYGFSIEEAHQFCVRGIGKREPQFKEMILKRTAMDRIKYKAVIEHMTATTAVRKLPGPKKDKQTGLKAPAMPDFILE